MYNESKKGRQSKASTQSSEAAAATISVPFNNKENNQKQVPLCFQICCCISAEFRTQLRVINDTAAVPGTGTHAEHI